MPGGLRFSSGRGVRGDPLVTVTMDDGFTRFAHTILREAGGVVVAGIEREIEGIYTSARAQWPVRTGRSKAGLDWYLRWDQGTGIVKGVITNDVQYWIYIRSKVRDGWDHVLTALVNRPVKLAAERLVATLGPDIVRAVRAGRG